MACRAAAAELGGRRPRARAPTLPTRLLGVARSGLAAPLGAVAVDAAARTCRCRRRPMRRLAASLGDCWASADWPRRLRPARLAAAPGASDGGAAASVGRGRGGSAGATGPRRLGRRLGTDWRVGARALRRRSRQRGDGAAAAAQQRRERRTCGGRRRLAPVAARRRDSQNSPPAPHFDAYHVAATASIWSGIDPMPRGSCSQIFARCPRHFASGIDYRNRPSDASNMAKRRTDDGDRTDYRACIRVSRRSCRAAEDQRGVGAAEAERIGQHDVDLALASPGAARGRSASRPTDCRD